MNTRRIILQLIFIWAVVMGGLGHINGQDLSAQEASSAITREEANGQPPPPPTPVYRTTPPKIMKIGKHLFQVGSVLLDRKQGLIKIPGKINMSDGLVEYLACTPYGKLHESVLSLDASPYHIQIALLLLGADPGSQPIEFQGAEQQPCGSPVEINISWKNENRTRVVYPPETLLVNINSKQAMAKADWVFTGSQIMNGQYMAEQEGSIIASFHDPSAIIDHRSITGADDTLYHANKKVLPPVGTPVEVTISPITEAAAKARTACNAKTQPEMKNE